MRAKVGCLMAVMGIVTGAWAVELKNGAEFAMAEIPVEAMAELPKGGSIRFSLEENATTGYEWTAAYSSNEVEVVVEHRGPLVKDGRCGAPGVAAVRATLKGNDAAPVFIEMKYARAWEKGTPAKTMRIVLYKVKDGITSSNYPQSRTLAMLKAHRTRSDAAEALTFCRHLRRQAATDVHVPVGDDGKNVQSVAFLAESG